MNIKRTIIIAVAAMTIMAVMTTCKVTYSLSGASIHVDAKTVSIPTFPNNASMVAPILSSTLTEALQDRFSRQTKLTLVPEDGDLAFEGEIINYISAPSSVSGEQAVQNRLTITVRVRCTNRYEPQYNINNRTFSAFADYNTSQSLMEVEGTLIPDIVETLVDDIFNAAVSNW